MELTHFQHAVGQNAFHFVWKCKYAWDPFKFEKVKELCETSLREVATKYGFEIYELSIQPDHIHLFVEVPHTISISKSLQLFKGYSAYRILKQHNWLRKYFRKGHFWSPGKFFRSVGNVTTETIQHYIAQSQGAWNFVQQRKVTSFA